VLGNCCIWIPVKVRTLKRYGDSKSHRVDDSIELGDQHALENFIYEHGFAKAAVSRHNDEYVVRLHAEQRNAPGAFLTKLAAAKNLPFAMSDESR
jgi:hypothetical protein